MVCKNCGSQVDSEAKFCGVCGTKVEDVSQVTSDENDSLNTDVKNIDNSFSTEVENVNNSVNTNVENIDNSFNENQVEYKIESTKSGKKIGFIIVILILLCAVLGGVYYYLNNVKNNTGRIVKGFINSVYEKLDFEAATGIDFKNQSVVIDGNFVFSTNIPDLENIDGERLNYKFGFDYSNKKMELGAALEEKDKEIFNGNLYVLNNMAYVSMDDIFDGIVKVGDFDFDKIFNFDSSDLKNSQEDNIYVFKALKDIFIDSLNMDDFTKSKDSLDIDGKNVEVTRISYELTDQRLNKIISNMVDGILNDSKLVEILSKMSGADTDSYKKSISDLKENDYNLLKGSSVKFDIYTKGFNNSFVGMDINGVIKVRKNGDVTTINIGFASASASIVITEKSDGYDIVLTTNIDGNDIKVNMSIQKNVVDDKTTKGTLSLSVSYGNYSLGINNNYTVSTNSSVANVDVTNSKDIKIYDEDEIGDKLYKKFKSSAIYSLFNKSLDENDDYLDNKIIDQDYENVVVQNNGKDKVLKYAKSVELAYTQYMYSKALETLPNEYGSSVYVPGSVKVNFEGNDLYLVVDFTDDNVVCSGDNSIDLGKLTLKNCVVSGDSAVYDYSNGSITVR